MECAQSGASVARVAQSHGLNANMVHAWRRQERNAPAAQYTSTPAPVTSPAAAVQFIAVPLPASAPGALPDIRIELRRGATTVNVCWPAQAAVECASWLREWLR